MSNPDWAVPRGQHETFLADPYFERDACGTGFLADLHARASHKLLQDALTTIARLSHRGAVAADGKTGDGSGILTQIPYQLLAHELEQNKIVPPAEGELAVGMMFVPRDREPRARAMQIAERIFAAHHLEFLMWRQVPVSLEALGEHAFRTRPYILQALLARGKHIGIGDAFERALYFARKEIERAALKGKLKPFYVASLSARTLVYKGLFVSPLLAPFYFDLRNPLYETALALVHQRYSTNTFPSWELAQPFRMLCHNGEINTLSGNIAWMNAREPYFASSLFGDFRDADGHLPIQPLLDLSSSDSGILDNALELVALAGRELPHAAMMLLPEAWENVRDLDPQLKAFYHYHATLMEPWDGPAAICFSDGRVAGMTLDRNGLRPATYLITHDGLVVASSEAGALEVDVERIREKGRLGPGQMIVADLQYNKLWHNDEIKTHYASRHPYAHWVSEYVRVLGSRETGKQGNRETAISNQQSAFGYTDEELVVLLRPMAENKAEAIGSMGDDTPHAVLSEFDRPLYHFFRQRFAEVTNPPIDPLREELVMSLRVLSGGRGNILEETPSHAHLLELKSPFLTDVQLAQVRALDREFPHATLDATFDAQGDADALERAVEELCAEAERAVRDGKTILLLSDRNINADRAPMPMLLAVSAVHQHLLRARVRWQTSIIAETGEARDVHQFACLIGYGANAINPYLALATIREMYDVGNVRRNVPSVRRNVPSVRRNVEIDAEHAQENYMAAANKGLLKIMSKMGIATLDAYHGAQLFECIGVSNAVVAHYFAGTPSHIGGIGLREMAATVLNHHRRAFGAGRDVPVERLDVSTKRLYNYGFFKFKKGGEYHSFNPEVVNALHDAVRTPDALDGNYREAYEKYLRFASLVNERPATDLADFMEIKRGAPIPLSEVMPARELVKHFSVAAMSHGALSLEAHKTLSEAMNRLGAYANSGEGGEHPSRYGTLYNSAIKQVASARFGVTPAYLMNASELQIKMAQGSKPGEGGQLPGQKVSLEIAAVRHAQPGITLISPPPHHDIYSIEDLAQLIYDLKRINPRAKVSVKLVAQAGVGTIAAGVAKAYADIVHISGHSGGTGASPLSSIKHAGIAWELGLAETQQVLVANDLRGRVRLRVDGGLKTGRHVVIGALLGAEEFSFGTAAVIASGCIMARACHLNSCPVGVATQKQELRKKFPQIAEWVMAYFLFVAEETRELLAQLGARTLDEIVGRVELLEYKQSSVISDQSSVISHQLSVISHQWAVSSLQSPVSNL
ncbi:MAG: glutamate synthase large subunit [Chloroflexi bacterium]|nr:glutamate synthase large subunit [Chloroflexota bacterium]